MPRPSSSSSGAVFLDRPRAIEAVRAAVRQLANRHAEILEVWLFGSLARGDATPRSDADLLIVVDHDSRRPMDRALEFMRHLPPVRRPVDLIVVTRAEWAALGESRLHREIVTRGLRLYP